MTELTAVADAILAAHNTGRPTGVPALAEWSGLGVEAHDLPIGTLIWGDESTKRVGGSEGPLANRTIRLRVEYLTKALTGPPAVSAQRAAETLRAWAVKALAGNLLSGLAVTLEEVGTLRKVEQAEVPFARTLVEFDLVYTSTYNDLERSV
jgi:hypothetical protein